MKPASDFSDLAAGLGSSGLAVHPRASLAARWRDYYELTKPRMNFLVLCTTAVGYALAQPAGAGNWGGLLHALLGTALTAASAATLNQLTERHFDGLMPRTRNRPLPARRIMPAEAMWFGTGLGLLGIAYLALAVNVLTALLGAFTLVSYVLIYTPMKRTSSLNTIVGAVPGAIPPMMGVTAATGALNAPAMALFAILFLWQMPHFLAIAILYRRDYALGGFKMLPVIDPGLHLTGPMIVLYAAALLPASLLPSSLAMAGNLYLAAAVLLGLLFLGFGVNCAMTRTRASARKLFVASIIYLPLLLAAMMIDKL